mmetsp:Transcript_84746/g.237257  ORF Transcript_84746/g.237257 Transcript_84746/m.237257 type:complete len:355 (-) Transcript_84746:1147-2211(-)
MLWRAARCARTLGGRGCSVSARWKRAASRDPRASFGSGARTWRRPTAAAATAHLCLVVLRLLRRYLARLQHVRGADIVPPLGPLRLRGLLGHLDVAVVGGPSGQLREARGLLLEVLLREVRRAARVDGHPRGLVVLVEVPPDHLLRVRVGDVLGGATGFPPRLLVLVPRPDALVDELVQRVRYVVHLVLVRGVGGTQLRGPRAHAVHDDHRRVRVDDVVHIRRLVLVVLRLVNGQLRHNAELLHPVELLRVVEQELVQPDVARRADPCGERGEVRRVHAGGIEVDDAPPIAIAIEAVHGGHVVEAVHGEVAEQAQRFQHHAHVLEPPTARQVQRVLRAPLQRVHDILQLAARHR